MDRITQEQYNELITRGLTPEKVKILAKGRGLLLPRESFSPGANLPKPTAKGLLLSGAKALPTIGAIAGGFGGTFLGSPVGGLAGGAIGATAGKSAQNLIEQTIGDKQMTQTEAVLDPLATGALSYLAGKTIETVSGAIAPTVKKVGEITYKGAIPLSKKEAGLVQAYKAKYPLLERIRAAITGKTLPGDPTTVGETAARQGVWGTESMIGVQAKRAKDNLWNSIVEPALKSSKEKIDFKTFAGEIDEIIKQIPENTRRKTMEKAFEAFKQDYATEGAMDLLRLQSLKEGWTQFLGQKAFRGEELGNAFREVQKIASQLARNKIYKAVPSGVKEAYWDYGNLKGLMEIGQKAMTRAKFQGGAGSFVSGVFDKAVTPVATSGGKTIYTVGEGLDFVGDIGKRTLGELFGL